MANAVALQCNWKGKRGKYGLHSTVMKQIICGMISLWLFVLSNYIAIVFLQIIPCYWYRICANSLATGAKTRTPLGKLTTRSGNRGLTSRKSSQLEHIAPSNLASCSHSDPWKKSLKVIAFFGGSFGRNVVHSVAMPCFFYLWWPDGTIN